MNTDEKILLEDGLARLLNVITLLYDPDYVWDDIKNEVTIAARDIRLVLDKSEKAQVTQLLDEDIFDIYVDLESEWK